jgi:hypothetical protein
VQSLTVSAPCSVCAFDNSPFLAITRGTCASKELQFHVAPNGGAERHGAIVLPGLLVPVIQDGR